MTISRIYQDTLIELNQTLQIDEKASHHLARVLRAKVADTLILFNGQPFQGQLGEFEAVITQIHKKVIEVKILRFHPANTESPLNICLAQGIARGEKMDFIIQKACELGVNAIQPLITSRCNVKLEGEREEKRLMHWRSVIQSACEQSGRNHLPTIAAPIT